MLPDGGGLGERLLPGDPEPWGKGWPGCDFRWPSPVLAWRGKHDIACNVHVTGTKLRHGSTIGRTDGMWARVRIEWVGDCEPSTFCGGYMAVA